MAETQWTEVEARAVIEAWKASGQSVYSFSESRGFRNQRLYYWLNKLGEGHEVQDVRMVPVEVTEPASATAPSVSEPVLVMLRSGIVLNRPRLRRWTPPQKRIDKEGRS